MKLHGIRLVICSGDMQKWRLRLSDVSSTTEVKTNSSIQNKKSKIVQSTNLDETSCKILGVASNWMRVIKCLALQTRMKKNKYLWLINLHLPLPSWRVSYCLLQNSGRDKHEREIIPIVLQLHWTQQIVDYFIRFLGCV